MNQRLGNGQLFSNHMLPFSNKFNACRIQTNKLNSHCFQNQDKQYVLQQPLPPQTKIKAEKQNIKPGIQEFENYRHFEDIREKSTLFGVINSARTDPQEKIQHKQTDEEELIELWNKMESQQQKQQQKAILKDIGDKELKNQKQQIVMKRNDSNSSCELSPEQLEKWLQSCKYDIECNNEQKDQTAEVENDRQICPIQSQKSQKIQTNEQKPEDWGSWAQIVDRLQSNTQAKTQYNNQSLAPLVNNIDTHTTEEQFVILDTPVAQKQKFSTQDFQLEQSPQQLTILQQAIKYGPWKFNYQPYLMFDKYELTLIHQLKFPAKENQQKLQLYRDNALLSLRRINWEIKEEKKPEIMALGSKRNCHTNLLQYGKDFFIYDHLKFAVSPLKQNSHMYFGAKTLTILRQPSQKKRESMQNQQNSYIKDYLYLPGNGQCFLETCYPKITQSLKERKAKKFSVHLSLTKQKVAVCERLIVNDAKEKKEVIQIKSYDQFQGAQGQYLGIVQTKISNFSQQWYCDTIINIPRKKVYSNKVTQKNWDQLKIQLRLSETGTIVAQLGIFDADSSVTNCILFGQNKISQFMMGTIAQTQNQINYIVRISGISPIVGFIALLSRQIFVLSQ